MVRGHVGSPPLTQSDSSCAKSLPTRPTSSGEISSPEDLAKDKILSARWQAVARFSLENQNVFAQSILPPPVIALARDAYSRSMDQGDMAASLLHILSSKYSSKISPAKRRMYPGDLPVRYAML